MQILGLLLILINIGAIAVPVTGAVLMYRDNLAGLVIPPELDQLIDETSDIGSQLQLPQFVNYTYDQEAKIITLIFNFTNPFNLNITVNNISADILCNEHNLYLGSVGIADSFELNKDVTAYITIIFAWTLEAENHFLNEHIDESTIDVILENIVVDISGITIEAPNTYNIDNIPVPTV